MNTVEGNKLIAEFMGFKCSKSGKTFRMSNESSPYRKTDLHYHSSWDLLMPACKKFDTIKRGSLAEGWNRARNRIYEQHCDCIDNAVTRYDILPAFERLVDAIEWYNSLNTQTLNKNE